MTVFTNGVPSDSEIPGRSANSTANHYDRGNQCSQVLQRHSTARLIPTGQARAFISVRHYDQLWIQHARPELQWEHDAKCQCGHPGLNPSTTYHFRIVGMNDGGPSSGDDMTFTTPSACTAPSATTGSANPVTSNSATLNGTVNPNGCSTTVYFQARDHDPATDHYSQPELQWEHDAKCHCGHPRVKSEHNVSFPDRGNQQWRTSYGDDMTFTTPSVCTAPSATTGSASPVTSNSATLNGTVNLRLQHNGLFQVGYDQLRDHYSQPELQWEHDAKCHCGHPRVKVRTRRIISRS